MTQAYLYLRWRSTANSQMAAFKEVNRQLTQIGSDFGIKSPSTNVNIAKSVDNRLVNWEDDLYAVGVSGVWKYDVSTSGPWTLAHTFSNRNTDPEAESWRMGLTVGSVDGIPNLYTAYPAVSAAAAIRLVTISSTGIFESSDITITGADYNNVAQCAFQNPISYRNTISWVNEDSVVELDLQTKATSIANFSGPELEGGSLCVFRDKLFVLRSEGTVQRVRRKDGTTMTAVVTLSTAQGFPGLANTIRPVMIPIDDKLICFFFLDGNSGGIEGYEAAALIFSPGSTSSPIINRITNNVLPTSLSAIGGTDARNSRITARIDVISSGVANPLYELEFWTDGGTGEGTSVDLYSYIPPSGTIISLIDSGLDGDRFSTIFSLDGVAGINIWPGSGTLNVSPPDLSINGPNITATFKTFGGDASLNNTVALQLLFDKEGEHTLSVGTLSATSVGALQGVTTVTGISPGDTVTVTWNASLDGITNVDNPKVSGRIFVP